MVIDIFKLLLMQEKNKKLRILIGEYNWNIKFFKNCIEN